MDGMIEFLAPKKNIENHDTFMKILSFQKIFPEKRFSNFYYIEKIAWCAQGSKVPPKKIRPPPIRQVPPQMKS